MPIAVKRREAKSKGEKERYKHLNAEFQRIARRHARRQNGCLRWSYKQLRKEEEQKAKEKSKDTST